MGYKLHDCNEQEVDSVANTYWRASLVPAAAVIPAPLVYTRIVAVKAFGVGSTRNGFNRDLWVFVLFAYILDEESWVSSCLGLP